MVAVATLRTDPKCIARRGCSSPFLQALDMDVLKEGKERTWDVQDAIDGSVRAKTYADGSLAKTRSDQPPKLLVRAIKTDSTLWRSVRRGTVSALLVCIFLSLHACIGRNVPRGGCSICGKHCRPRGSALNKHLPSPPKIVVDLVGGSPRSWDLSNGAKSAGCHSGSLDVLGHECTKSCKLSARVVFKKRVGMIPPLALDSPTVRCSVRYSSRLERFQSLCPVPQSRYITFHIATPLSGSIL